MTQTNYRVIGFGKTEHGFFNEFVYGDIQKVKNLSPHQICYINWNEEGGGEVHRSADTLILFCIPQYGGDGYLVGEFDFNDEGIEALVKEAHSWT